ncbi:MAG: ABC transporter permease [Candidatus Dormibacteraeota bacterium]|nr:ABC transporter permease [Candidatus Dormibacteraeota bacterium]MBV8445499.1 ABC transporter permease [Candidatus Dormibacteraeota bacterium]
MLNRGTLIYIAQRVVLIAFTVMVVSFGVFVVVHSLPGNAFISDRLHGKALQLLLHQYGLDQPVVIQYWNWLKGAIHGDLGISLVTRGAPITPIVLKELSVSAMVGGAALLVTIGLGVTFGVIAAIRQNTWVDYTLTTFAVIGYSVPSFVIASLGILIFANWLNNVSNGAFYYPLPWQGTYGGGGLSTLISLSLPAISIGLYTSGQVTRITRASMLEVIQQDYIRTARAKGLKSRRVTVRHALRNALVPVMSIMPSTVLGILTGVVVIENIFTIPGLGKEFVTSITQQDYNLTVGVFTIYAVLIGFANLIVDLLYAVVDPRIRY